MLQPTSCSTTAVNVESLAVEPCVTAEVLAPRAVEQSQRIKSDLRLGLPVLLEDGRAKTLVALVEGLSEARYRAMWDWGTPELVMTRRRAEAMGINWPSGGEVLRLALPAGTELKWLAAVSGILVQPDVAATLAGLQLQIGNATQRTSINLAKTTERVPAVLTVPCKGGADVASLMAMSIQDLDVALETTPAQAPVSSAPLPMAVSRAGRVHVFRPEDYGVEHYAIEVGNPNLDAPVTVRLHSACFTGDVLGSLKCDCGPQLRAAMEAMAEEGGGVLLYLNQEGRGIGLANKMRTYVMQDSGLDTVEANHWLGFEDDQRDFRIGVLMLKQLGIKRIRLLTNNPAKVNRLQDHGITIVERLPLRVGDSDHNARYLETKAKKSGHLL